MYLTLCVGFLYHVRYNYDIVIVFIWKLSMILGDIILCQVENV